MISLLALSLYRHSRQLDDVEAELSSLQRSVKDLRARHEDLSDSHRRILQDIRQGRKD